MMNNEKQKEFDALVKTIHSLKNDVDSGEYHYTDLVRKKSQIADKVLVFVLGESEAKELNAKMWEE